MLGIQSLIYLIAFVSASRLIRRELEEADTVCANWFGNNLNWDTIPFQNMAPWGLTPDGCTEAIVEPYGEYSCATYDTSTGSKRACNGDCADGVCVDGYAAQTTTTQSSVVCSPGEYQDGANCAPCDPGQFNANVGGVCSPCPQGTHASTSGSVECTACEVGYIAAYAGAQYCELCPQGYTTSGYGQTECFLASTIAPTQEPTSLVCSTGEYQVGTDCVPCAPGQYNANVGGVCSPCPQGTYASQSGSVECTACEIGFIAPYAGAQYCELCPQGYTTSGYGQVECFLASTQEPTVSPSVAPTSTPTTSVPSFSPSEDATTDSPSRSPTQLPTIGPSFSSTANPTVEGTTTTASPTSAATFNGVSLNVVYQNTRMTCKNGSQKIRQPCNGGRGTGCSYDSCVQHCIDESQCNFFFHIDRTLGCILYSSCTNTRVPFYSGTTVEITRN